MYNNNRYYNRSNNNYNAAPMYRNSSFYSSAPKKKSGAKFVRINNEDCVTVVSAWRVNSNRELLTLYARPYSKTHSIDSKSGKTWLNYFVTIVNKTSMQVINTSALFDVQAKRLYLKEFNQIVTNGGNGGYWGTHISKRR